MGFLDLFRRPRSLVASEVAAPAAPAPVKPEGIDGGGNIGGRTMFEPNIELRDQAGYGRAGTYEVGQWQAIMQSNPFVSMALDHVLRPIADARVDITPAKNAAIDEATATMHADFVRWALTEKFQLSRLSKVAAQGFLLSGFSLFEPLAELAPYQASPAEQVKTDARLEKGEITTRPPTEMWVIRDCPQRLPNSLDPSSPWRIDDTGRLQGIAQMGPVGMSGKWLRTVMPAERALLLSWKRLAGNFAGESQLRTCWYLAAKPMPMLSRMIGVTLQREGPGIPQAISTTDKAKPLTPEQREDLIELYADMSAHESSGMVMPMGWKTEWTFSPISNKGHLLDVYERMGMYILQQFGAQQLMLGVGETGSRSVGEVHDARSMAMVKEVLGFLADAYNGARGEADGLVNKLIDWNFGPQAAYPKLQLIPQRPELAPESLAKTLSLGKAAGIFTPLLKDENSFREKVGAPTVTEEELEAEREKIAARAPQMPEAEDDEDGAPGPKQPKGKMPPAFSASAPRVWAPWRALRASEQKLKLNDIDAFFTQQREFFARWVMPEVLAMLGTAAPALDRAMADGKLTPEEVAAIPLNTKRLDGVLAELLAKTRQAGATFTRNELAAHAFTAATDDDELIAETDALVTAAKNAVKRRIENRVRSGIEREAIDVIRTGGTAQEVVARTIARQLDLGSFKSDAGSVTTKVFNVGRDEAARLIGGVASVEYSAILDSATCDPCRNMDGRTAAFDSPEHDAMLPPNRDCDGGDNCRCLLVFIPERGES